MKRICVFIGLKIAEISGIIFIPYLIGRLVSKWGWYVNFMNCEGEPYWAIGLITIIMIAFLIVLSILVGIVIHANWKWAKSIIT